MTQARSYLLLTLAFLVIVGAGFWHAYGGRIELVDAQRNACERAKLDRAANAAGWTAHRAYIAKVAGAASVKDDVKAAARTAHETYRRISVGLSARARLDCVTAHPPASLLP